jgi:uncharacterized protein (DUF433 family)
MSVAIINNRIDGLRITIYDVLHYLENGRTPEEITTYLPLTLEQVQAAQRYIEEHEEEVMAVHRQIEERIARGNPPEIEAMARESHARLMARVEERRRAKNTEVNGEGAGGGR